ncbi:MAG: NADH-quinone oxidoreductase subunit NuoN, partial [Rhodospirillales bacterium]|nr:NADH-quinone oxidoreductase subunit NuoN [Rhodospirillales bacterium]
MTPLPDLLPALPEIVIACGALILLLYGVFAGDRATGTISWLAVLTLATSFFVVLGTTNGGRILALSDLYVADVFSGFMKCLVLIASAVTIIMSLGYIKREKMNRFEYPVLMLLAVLGMGMMVSATDLMSLYVGLELQSLSLYVLAAFRRDSLRSNEAGLKYFVLGALSSGMLLYGCSLIYGFTGSTSFFGIAAVVAESNGVHSLGLLFGIVFLTAGLAFKISAVPFHMWTPDVYEGAPTPITAFFALAPKVAAFALLVRVMTIAFAGLANDWQQIIVFLSIASMVVGAFAAIGQTNIKRLMAYSSIGHMGYALIGLAAGTQDGIRGVIIYLTIYLVMNVGAFGCILSMRRGDVLVEDINDLAGLARRQPMFAFALAIFMFSLAGIPLLAGFFAKLYVFLSAIDAG